MNFFSAVPAFSVMTKPVGARCNLNCTYCYYLEKEKLYPNAGFERMSEPILEEFVKQYILSQPASVISFVWQGGEPMLAGLEFYRQAIEFQKKYAGEKQITNAFQTNGILMNSDWCKFFQQNNFLVGISIDGPESLHDAYRRHKSGTGTWRDVMKGIRLLQDYHVEFNTLTVIHHQNADHPIDVYSFLKSIGSRFHQYIPIVERKIADKTDYPLSLVSPDFPGEAHVTSWSVTPEQYGNFYIKIFNEWVTKDVGSVFVQEFDAILANWIGAAPGVCVFAQQCGSAALLEFNGDLFSCDHYVYPENRLGNIVDIPMIYMMQSAEQRKFGMNKIAGLPQECLHCKYLRCCHGECPKHRFSKSSEKDRELNYLCSGLKQFFRHATPYMEFMANEFKNKRPPANVMVWARQRQD